ncbi:MAG: cysteine desulfurase [Tissierellales bacterium]|jgi:cysteine desulfurase|nr:cysteine desulfurase [Tissierellales bacterium]
MESMVYMDYAATTGLDREALDIMAKYSLDFFGNPSSVYSFSRESKKIIDETRQVIGGFINAPFKDIYFTSGATESNNWAIRGIMEANKEKGKHMITTKIEHHATLRTCEYLEDNGYDVTYLPVDCEGKISLTELKKHIREDTVLISLIFANNEVGSVQPIKEVGKICAKKDILFHTDAVQAIGHVPIDVESYGIDLLSFSAHKLHGPKGLGGLYIKNGLNIKPLIYGGAQQNYKRAGTENLPAIAAFKVAFENLIKLFEEENNRFREYRNKLYEGLCGLEGVWYNGPEEEHFKISNILNVGFEDIESESLLLALDQENIMVSAGSACASGALDPSHVLTAMGLDEDRALASLRFSIGRYTTEDEIDYVIKTVCEKVRFLRTL